MRPKIRYFVFNKPYDVLSQFTREAGHQSIADFFILDLKDVYPIGRLDKDSEGMLLLTNDKSLNSALLSPKALKTKTYLVQVEGKLDKTAISKLSEGIRITIDKKEYTTLPAKVKMVDEPKHLWERNPPVRYRKEIPTTWAEISIKEGKNRQIRRMFAAVGFPVLRLVRIAVENLVLDRILPGDVQEFDKQEFFNKLNIK
jgi:23S rRNA pseudouridine2457 synthase